MASWNDNWSNIGYSYYGDPCPYCGGSHLGQNCASQSDVWNFCTACGCQGGHWNGCPNSYYPSQGSYYNVSNNVYEFCRCNEVEDIESMTRIMDMIRQIAEQQNMMRQIVEQQSLDALTIKRLQARMDELMANFQEKSQFDKESEFPQEDYFEEADIVSQSLLEEQAQLIKSHEFLRDGLSNMTEQLIDERTELRQEIDQFGLDMHDLHNQLNKKVEASDVLQPIFVDTGQLEERKEELQLFDQNIINDTKVDEECKIEDVKNNTILELEHIGPHSKYFSTLCLVGDMGIDPVEHMKESMDEEQSAYILKFVMSRRQNDIPHLKAKKCKMRYLLLGVSDHSPIIINTLVVKSYLPKPFRLYNELLHNKEFEQVVEEAWGQQIEGYKMKCVWMKLMRLKDRVMKLNKEMSSLDKKLDNLRKQLKNTQENLDKDPFNTELISEERELISQIVK
ncbi:uncharacterized protein [Nicotiana sylvestris]|uniref:uncharacterized protein n=1 Tax=Nicotiana sylvestris TaxID=4096 RepID=UPI00388CCE48